MLRSTLSAFLVCLSIACLAGCSDDPDTSSSSSGGAKTSNSTTPPEEKDDAESIGPQCTAYFACCEEVAESQPSLAGSCDSTKKSVADAVEGGASTTTYESSCKQALAAMQGGGYCK